MASHRNGPQDGRPSPLGSSQIADELGSPSRLPTRLRARTVARPHRPDRKAGPAGTPRTPHEGSTSMGPHSPETFGGIDVSPRPSSTSPSVRPRPSPWPTPPRATPS